MRSCYQRLCWSTSTRLLDGVQKKLACKDEVVPASEAHDLLSTSHIQTTRVVRLGKITSFHLCHLRHLLLPHKIELIFISTVSCVVNAYHSR